MNAQFDRQAVEEFIFFEARLQDQHRYDDWEALWAEDALYWVPAGNGDIDPETQVSYIYDNRRRISSRVRQLNTGKRHSQAPQSGLCRIISNLVIKKEDDIVTVECNFHLYESRHGELRPWAGTTTYKLRTTQDGFKLVTKKVVLVNAADAIANMAFLI